MNVLPLMPQRAARLAHPSPLWTAIVLQSARLEIGCRPPRSPAIHEKRRIKITDIDLQERSPANTDIVVRTTEKNTRNGLNLNIARGGVADSLSQGVECVMINIV